MILDTNWEIKDTWNMKQTRVEGRLAEFELPLLYIASKFLEIQGEFELDDYCSEKKLRGYMTASSKRYQHILH